MGPIRRRLLKRVSTLRHSLSKFTKLYYAVLWRNLGSNGKRLARGLAVRLRIVETGGEITSRDRSCVEVAIGRKRKKRSSPESSPSSQFCRERILIAIYSGELSVSAWVADVEDNNAGSNGASSW